MKQFVVTVLAAVLVIGLAGPTEAATRRKATISVSDRSITVGEAVRVAGQVRPAPAGVTVTVRKRVGAGRWTTVKKVRLGAAGTYSHVDRPARAKPVRYRVTVSRKGSYAGSTSRVVKVVVTRPKARDLTTAELRRARVPSLCGHRAGRLVRGSLPGIAPNGGEVTFVRAVFGELDAKGGRDAAVVIRCNRGGVGWPDHVLLYTANAKGKPAYRGRFDTYSVVRFGRESVRSIRLVARRVTVDVHAGEPWECMACGTVAVRAQLVLHKGRVAVRSTSRYGAREALASFLAAANRGDLAAARRLAQQQQYYENPADVAVREVREGGVLSPLRRFGPAPYAACSKAFSTSATTECAARNAARDHSLTLRYGGWRDWKVTWMI